MMRPGIYYATLAAMILGFGIGGRTAFSDIWPEPYKKEYQSSERSFLFRVSPRRPLVNTLAIAWAN